MKSDLILFACACAMVGYFACYIVPEKQVEAAIQSELSVTPSFDFEAPAPAPPVQFASAPQTKIVWSRSCQGGSCTLVPRRVAVTDSSTPVSSASRSRSRSRKPLRKLFSRRPLRRLFSRCGR